MDEGAHVQDFKKRFVWVCKSMHMHANAFGQRGWGCRVCFLCSGRASSSKLSGLQSSARSRQRVPTCSFQVMMALLTAFSQQLFPSPLRSSKQPYRHPDKRRRLDPYSAVVLRLLVCSHLSRACDELLRASGKHALTPLDKMSSNTTRCRIT